MAAMAPPAGAARFTVRMSREGSRISFEDFALALVDELETTAHPRRRFTVGY